MPKSLNGKVALRLMELARSPYRPKVIADLQARIEGEKRAAELAFSVTGIMDEGRIRKIVAMKLDLDRLYVDWAEGRIG